MNDTNATNEENTLITMDAEHSLLGVRVNDTCIFVASYGHTWICSGVYYDAGNYHLVQARIIREWGTTKGLNQLVHGPTQSTVLDAIAPIVTVAGVAALYRVPSSDSAWEPSFR